MDTSILDLETASSVTETTDYIPVVDTSDTSEDSSGTTKKTTVRTLLADKALPVGDFVGTVGAQTLENKTIDADDNIITNLTLSNLKSGVLDTDLSSVSGSDDTIPSAKATKALIDSLTNGWIPAEETWTYASSTTFTISGDKTGKYQKGDKIKLTQTTVKYFYIIGISYSNPNTTITIAGGSDYSLANAEITNPYYSKIENPQGFPQYFSYTPTVTASGSMTISSLSILLAKFKMIGQMVQVFLHLDFTTGGTASNTVYITIPVASTTTNIFWAGAVVATGGLSESGFGQFQDTSKTRVRNYNSSNWTLGVNRQVACQFTYPI